MTDSEIMKALECCLAPFGERCGHCSLLKTDLCINVLLQNILDLINRQKAEIERLQKVIDKAATDMADIKTAINKVDVINEHIKAEAYKEFANRLDATTWYHINKNGELVEGANSETDIPLYRAEDIFNLLKELEGEQ